MKEWELRLLYKRLKKADPQIRMVGAESGSLKISCQDRALHVRSEADYKLGRDWLLGLACGCDYYSGPDVRRTNKIVGGI